MMFVCAVALCAFQDPDLAAVQASEARRTATIARCMPAVCSVMAMDEPGGGSGVVIDPAGFVLTNYHVVGSPDDDYQPPEPPAPDGEDLAAFRAEHPDATEADVAKFASEWQTRWREDNQPRGSAHYKNKKVGLPDGLLYEAEVLGIDPGSDLALLRLLPHEPGQTWPACSLGDSDQLLVGETVFAMGNPFLLATDFTPTVTFGIVSGTHRYQEGQGNRMLVYPDCIQVDAPVNPGNSGGPLFDEAGEVIGINGRISIGDRGRVNVGVGFAIASNQIRNFLGDLLAGRHAEHGTLDMSAWFMNSRESGAQQRGVYAQQMFKDSVAAQAGIGLGDEMTAFNGIEVRSANQLATLIGVLPAGSFVEVGHRPKLATGGFGDERRVTIRLSTLDTGSSQDGTGSNARMASRANRRRAAAALARAWQPAAAGGEWHAERAEGASYRARRAGERIRLDLGDLALVADGAGDGFALAGGVPRDLTADERARLDREARTNPFLWTADERASRLEGALLLGGVHVLGAPAYRFGLAGDGECEVWLFADGSYAGFAFRDPLRHAMVEWHVRAGHLRVVVDGAIDAGWSSVALGTGPFGDELFRRQP